MKNKKLKKNFLTISWFDISMRNTNLMVKKIQGNFKLKKLLRANKLNPLPFENKLQQSFFKKK